MDRGRKVGVMPISAVTKDRTLYVGAIVKMRWRGKKLYEAKYQVSSMHACSVTDFTDAAIWEAI